VFPKPWIKDPNAPEAPTGRASPPLLFDLAPRGVFRAPDVASRAVGSYPTFSPLPSVGRNRRTGGFSSSLPRRPRAELALSASLAVLFSVALSVAWCAAADIAAASNRAPWRYQARCPAVLCREAQDA
jgi:hypothetical protein